MVIRSVVRGNIVPSIKKPTNVDSLLASSFSTFNSLWVPSLPQILLTPSVYHSSPVKALCKHTHRYTHRSVSQAVLNPEIWQPRLTIRGSYQLCNFSRLISVKAYCHFLGDPCYPQIPFFLFGINSLWILRLMGYFHRNI